MPTTTSKRPLQPPSGALRPLVERIAVLEQDMAALKAESARRYAAEKPYLKSAGMLPDDEVTRDAERLGRTWRKRQK